MTGIMCSFVGARKPAAAAAEFVNDADTKMLLHMNGTDASTTFTDDDGSTRTKLTVTGNNNAQIDTAQSKFGGSSCLLDGTNDRLTVTYDASLAFGTNDFTIECWFRINSFTAGNDMLFDFRLNAGDNNIVIYLSNGVLKYYVGAERITGSGALSTGTWYHLAVARSGSSTKMFLDGTQVGSTYTDSTNYGCSSAGLFIGDNQPFVGQGEFNGWIDELRISKSARYTANFTAPTSAFTNDTNTVLLLHFDAADASTTFTDDNGSVRTAKSITASGNAQLDTAQYKFGTAAGLFDGTGDYLDCNFSTDIVATTGSETIECYVRASSWSGVLGICDQSASGQTYGFTLLAINGQIFAYWRGSASYTLSSTTTLSTNTWHHIAVVNDNGTGRLYINGTQEDSDVNWGDGPGTTTDFIIGYGRGNGSGLFDNTLYYFNGWIDEFRVSDTARYPNGTAFTPGT